MAMVAAIRNGIKSLVLVITFATIVPMPTVGSVDDPAFRRSMAFFPVVGLILGFLLSGSMWLGARFLPRFAAALMSLTLYVLITGALHLDGLADTFDALASRKPARDALAVMKDSRIGTMGAAAVMLVLMGKVTAFSYLPINAWGVWVVVPALARTSVIWLMAGVPAARPQGIGALYAGRLSKWTVIGATAVGLLAALVLLSWQQALVLLSLSAAVTALWAVLIRRRFGGASGDTYGALLEIVEWVGFLALTGGLGYGR